MSGVLRDIVDHWYIDFSIPLVAALIGYVTKLVAIRMMFQPLEFVGLKPYLGWQGIVPRERRAWRVSPSTPGRAISSRPARWSPGWIGELMPAFGLIVGWFTDWLALKMIFNPKEPIRILGVEHRLGQAIGGHDRGNVSIRP